MSPTLHSSLAETVLAVHVVIIAFNVFGLVAIPLGACAGRRFVRIFSWRALHLGAMGIVALQALLDRVCFLTIWQDELLAGAGQAPAAAPLVTRWVNRLIFWPLPLWVYAALYVAACAYTLWLWWLVPPRLPWRAPR